MLNNRSELILETLRSHNRFVTVEQLSAALFVSGATIRRDLAELEASRLIRRVRGGAVLVESGVHDDPVDFRENQSVLPKQVIAGLALAHIHDGMTLFLDSSSTVYAFARRLTGFNNLRIITNGIKNTNLLSDVPGLTVMCSGGVVRENSKSLIGASTLEYLSHFNADLALMSCRGFSVDGGATEASEEEYQVKRVFLTNSRSRFLLADSTKKDQEFLCKIAPLARFTAVITEDAQLNRQLERYTAGANA